MVFLLILLVFSCSNGALSLPGKELLSLKRLQNTPARHGPARFLHKSRTENGATILEMKHRDHTSRPMQDWSKHLEKRLIRDDIRVKSIQSRIKKSVSSQLDSPQTQIPISSGVKLQTLNYIVTVTLGSRNLTVIVDTGSDLSWVQCQPCRLCYTQPEPLFNPLISPSYRSVQCNSQPCHTLQYATGNWGLCGSNAPTCNYAVTYGDGSYTRGELGSDRLTLGMTPVEDFVFGCGRNNRGLFGAASGLMGLGRSDLSLISQTSDVFGGVFSYCLPDSDSGASGSLILGSDTSIFKNTTPVSYTRLVPNPQLNSFYILNMTGASVGGVSLQSSSFGKNGILIDSGTVITRLPPSVYTAVKGEFLKQFTGYPSAPSFSILDTCFNLQPVSIFELSELSLEMNLTVEKNHTGRFQRNQAKYQNRILILDLSFRPHKLHRNGQGRNILIIEVHQLQTSKMTKGIGFACSAQKMLYFSWKKYRRK